MLLGIPFQRGGRTPAGMDCLGLVLAGLRELRPELEIPDPWERVREIWRGGWRPQPGEQYPEDWTLLEATAPLQRGDVLTLDGFDEREGVDHLGLMISPRDVLHTSRATGSIVTRLCYLQPRLRYAMRPPPEDAP